MAKFLATESVHGLATPARLKAFHAYQALYDNQKSGEVVASGSSIHHAPSTNSASPSPPSASRLAGYHAADSEELFSDSIVFRDPFVEVHGLNDYKLQFASIHSLFRRIHLEVISVTSGAGASVFTPGGTAAASHLHIGSGGVVPKELDVLLIDAHCTYELNSWVQFKIRQLTRLTLDASGKIESHEDIWSIGDLIGSIPLFGRLYRVSQPYVGRLLSASLNGFYAWRAGVSIRQFREAQLSTNTIHAVYHPVESQKASIGSTLPLKDISQNESTTTNSNGSNSDSKKKKSGNLAEEKKRNGAAEQKAK